MQFDLALALQIITTLTVVGGFIFGAIIDDTIGGSIRAVWPRLRPWIEADRARAGNPYLEEWFEWLYLQLDRYSGKKNAPAASAHLDWRA